MNSPVELVVVLLLVVAPLWVVALRRGWMSRPGRRRWVWGVSALALLWAMPWGGVDFAHLKRLNLILLVTTAAVLLARQVEVGWLRDRKVYRGLLVGLAVLAALVHLNFLGFHGAGTYVHWHDVAHYYLGGKYAPELGYRDLYVAMLRAEAENHDNHFKAIEARDLETYRQVHIRTLLQRSDGVQEAFSPQRWQDFRADAEVFRRRLDRQYGTVLLDHGFNPTPVWTAIGGSVARWVPAGSERGLLALSLLDALLWVGWLVVLFRTLGAETTLLALILTTTLFGHSFGWTGGAFLRYLWFFAVVVACCALHRRRWGTAGLLFALATMLRVFPVVLLAPWGLRTLVLLWRRRRLADRDLRLWGGFVLGCVGLFVLSLVSAGGPRAGVETWRDFVDNLETHVSVLSPNTVGLTDALAYQGGPREITAEELAARVERRGGIHRAQLLLVFLPLLALVGRLALGQRPLAAVALGLPLLYGGLSLAGYYWIVLVVLLLWCRRRPVDLSLIFAAEAIPYTLMLFSEREANLFLAHGLALGILFAVLWGPGVGEWLGARGGSRKVGGEAERANDDAPGEDRGR